jgi:hypothetical protein
MEMIMRTLIRSVLVAAALIGAASAVSAAPRYSDSYSYGDNSFDTGPIAEFNRLTHKTD